VLNRIVAATPLDAAPPFVVTLTDNKSHWRTDRLPTATAQQFGGFGPRTVAMIPVAVAVTPQLVLLYISALNVSFAFKSSSRILNTSPVIVASCGTTILFRTKPLEPPDDVPSPRKC